jgi:hypothetical protein
MATAAAAATWSSLFLTAYTTYQAGEMEAEQYETQARAEESNAKTREIERKRSLVRALAAGNVKAGAAGVSGGVGSSQEALMKADIRRESLDEVVDAGATSDRISQLSSNASAARNYSLLSAGAGLAGGAAREFKRGSIKKKAE